MLLRYFYNAKLAHASYMVGCQSLGEALVVDPGRDIEPYLAEAAQQGMRITAVAETHIHADYLSGARELSARTGARLFLSDEGDAGWKYQGLDAYPHTLLHDGDTFALGRIAFTVMHSPGHTPEHIAFLVADTARTSEPIGIFTGDFVFAGDIGRPDLLEKAAGIGGTAEPGARRMFHSLRRFAALPEHLQVWPAHGAGSACGKALGAIPSSTVGYEKRTSWAFGYEDEDAFVAALLDGQPEPPHYFAMMKHLNKHGAPLVVQVQAPPLLGFGSMVALLEQGATVVDTRPASAFAQAHIAGSINIPFDGAFTTWAGWLLGYEEPFYLILDERQRAEVLRDLRSIGLDGTAGTFDVAVIEAWQASQHALQRYDVASPVELAPTIQAGEVTLLDVRGAGEREGGYIPGSRHMLLGTLMQQLGQIDLEKPIVVQCQSGGRSAIAASILQAHGARHVTNMLGGYRAWSSSGLPTTR
ncbi:MBL fold metallo-hydrolase [Chloroflexia bacterium SDU3-3]|nr:MBL fold metallo-hydrolase [Chloroflexia bacterium SDU3-3]